MLPECTQPGFLEWYRLQPQVVVMGQILIVINYNKHQRQERTSLRHGSGKLLYLGMKLGRHTLCLPLLFPSCHVFPLVMCSLNYLKASGIRKYKSKVIHLSCTLPSIKYLYPYSAITDLGSRNSTHSSLRCDLCSKSCPNSRPR